MSSAIVYGLYSFFQYIILRGGKISTISLAISVALIELVIGGIIYIVFKFAKVYNVPSMTKLETGAFKNYNKDIETMFEKRLPLGFGGALANAIGLVTLLLGYLGAPNPGFSDAISDAYLIPQAILTYLLFKVKMNGLQILGTITAMFGVYLLST
jgi:hypothetical protein